MSKLAKTASRPKISVAGIQKVAEPPISKETRRYREMIPQVEKRDGRLMSFDFDKIANAIWKAMSAAGEGSQDDAVLVAHQVAGELGRFAKKYKSFLPNVEGTQDSVEKYLILNDYVKTAKNYILYRDKRSQLRAAKIDIPEHVRKLSAESKKYFEGNVRDYYGIARRVNEKIMGSINSVDRMNFWCLNNGITIICYVIIQWRRR